jgi:hypothetical protein
MSAPAKTLCSATTMLYTSARQLSRISNVSGQGRIDRAAAVWKLLSSQRRAYATPAGPPPKGFRLNPPTEWDQEKEGTFDKAGKYFLLTEMARGMYVLLEQFFRPP